MPVGICASLDIGLSNWALEYVTISLYTMAKSSSILFIVGFSLLLRLERWKPILGATAALISSGLFLFTWKSTQLDLLGLLLIELAALCTGIRWAVSQYIMQREESPTPLRHPLDMVAHVQPWMILAILPMILIFEGSEITFQSITHYNGAFQPFVIFSLLVTGGLIAFLMEMSEYLLLMATSGITLNILGIIKEVISLLLAHLLHGDNYVSGVNLVGLLLVFIGMSLHGFSRHKAPAHSLTPPPRIISPSTDFADDRKFLLLDEPS
uniref:Sugar phosphate transporter domain-containing protein n=1 Tax=Acrobeloides nanus TaxID=290746 RepID=A0A914DPN3_9BILA